MIAGWKLFEVPTPFRLVFGDPHVNGKLNAIKVVLNVLITHVVSVFKNTIVIDD